MDEIVAGETESRRRTNARANNIVVILLAGLGIYGLLSFTVSLRQQEFGIRLALGARQNDIFKMVLSRGASSRFEAWYPGWFWPTSPTAGWSAYSRQSSPAIY